MSMFLRLILLLPSSSSSTAFSGKFPVQPSELLQGIEMKPSVLAASLEKRLLPRAARMRAAGIEPEFSRDFRALAQLTETQFRVSRGRGGREGGREPC